MSTYYYMILDVPLRMPMEDAERDLRGTLCDMPWHADDWDRQALIDDDIAFEIDEPDAVDADGLRFEDGRLRASLFFSNLEQEVGGEYVDGVEIRDMRVRAKLLLESLGRIADARPGDILGAFLNEHGEAGGPIVMTSDGVRWCYSNASGRDTGWSMHPRSEPETIRLTRIPTETISTSGEKPWSCSIDRDRIRAMHAAGLIEAPASAMRRITARPA